MKCLTVADGVGAIGRVPFDHSFGVLASLWGYSDAELEASLEEGALALYQSDDGRTLLRFASLDRVHAVATVQVWGAEDVAGVRDVLRAHERQQRIQRVCAYLFPWERAECGMLESLGFIVEATLRQHVYARGATQDLLVLGRLVEAT